MRTVLAVSSGGLEHGGGIGRMIGYMAAAWQARADGPRLVVVDSRGPARSFMAPFVFAACLFRIAAAGLTGRPLVHVHVAGRGSSLRKVMVAFLAKDILRLPVVLHLHDYDYRRFLGQIPSAAVRVISRMFRAADAVIVLGQTDRTTVIEVLGVAEEKVFIVPNCVPPPARAPVARDGGGKASVGILFLGDPSRRKGVHDLLEALASPDLASAQGRAPWRAVIAGGGGELEGFRRSAAALGLTDRVSFPGWLDRDAVAGLLEAADILALPSYGEGMAMSVLEAMSYGLCVVCTPVGALAEVIEDGVSGLLVTPGDPEGLARALARCVTDADLRARLGAGALERYRSGYAAETYPDRIAPVFAFADPR